ncbi:MAG TPA: ATP-binding protein [Chthoniobacteraceae bacterium]|jgi:hypothetical protein
MNPTILTHATSGPRPRAQKLCLYAPEGFGKSTFASRFPDPLFLDLEDSTSQLDVRRLGRDVLRDLPSVEKALAEIAATKPCASLVVDTVDWLEQLALEAIIAETDHPKIKGLEDFGYGKGYVILKERFVSLLASLDAVVAAGIHVVLLAHAKVTRFEPPAGAPPVDRSELKLTKHVAPLIKEWTDLLLFGDWEQVNVSAPAGAPEPPAPRTRLLHCIRTNAWDAKNRHHLGESELWDISTIERAFTNVCVPFDARGLRALADPPPIESEPGEILTAICEPHAEIVNAYLRRTSRIKPGEDWRAMPKTFASRVVKNPAGFLEVAKKEVAHAA